MKIECMNCGEIFISTKFGSCCDKPKRKYQSLGDRVLELELKILELEQIIKKWRA